MIINTAVMASTAIFNNRYYGSRHKKRKRIKITKHVIPEIRTTMKQKYCSTKILRLNNTHHKKLMYIIYKDRIINEWYHEIVCPYPYRLRYFKNTIRNKSRRNKIHNKYGWGMNGVAKRG